MLGDQGLGNTMKLRMIVVASLSRDVPPLGFNFVNYGRYYIGDAHTRSRD